MKAFDFKQLFILDLANNHQGKVRHGARIIDGCARAAQNAGADRVAVKFQFRHLPTFIHPAFRERADVPHIPRFLETALPDEAYGELAAAVRAHGMVTMATPFDEASVDRIEALDIEVIKIASCSAADYPLIERVAAARRPVVVSTAGLSMNQIDRLVNDLESKHVDFALMHCVALYPTARAQLNLNQIALLRERFAPVPVGFSTHEDPDNMDAVRMAVAKGAALFERHVGLAEGEIKLNAYSSSPDQVEAWMRACREAREMCGGDERAPAPVKETESLRSLMRGVYARRPLARDEAIPRDAVFFAMPLQEGQMTSGNWRQGLTADRAYEADAPLQDRDACHIPTKDDAIFQILLQVKGMLRAARIPPNSGQTVDLSHHYGLDRFREFGCALLDCVNRSYCKKLIVMLPRQKHPYHYHARKEETFQLLHGDLEVFLEGHRRKLALGETLLVEPGVWHKFHTLDGAVFEEISTTHFNDDSFYEDPRIARIPREERKTHIDMTRWS